VSASEQAAWFMAAAAGAYGSQVLAAPEDAGTAGPEALGRNLLRLVFGAEAPARGMPARLSALIASPDSPVAMTALEVQIEEALERDAGLAAALEEMLNGFYREQFESGNGQVLADLGSLLWWDDPQRARAAFECAIEAGNQHALIDLAKLRDAVLHDRDAALRTYQQAAESTDPDSRACALAAQHPPSGT
jgi:hypothetical protein